jgi:hypothetical protein
MGSEGTISATTLRRPLQLLIPIELTSSSESKKVETTIRDLNPEAEEFVPRRVRRDAGINGEIRRKRAMNI